MQGFVLNRYGGAEATGLQEVPCPVPGSGDVLVRVHAAGLNPVDFKTRDGMLKVVQGYDFPVVMGNELAGTVEGIGEGVTDFKPGDRVFVFTDGLYEAADTTGEEFGHQRLQQALSDQAGKATPLLLDSVLETVRAFGTSETATGFADDICVMGVDFGPRGSCPT